MEKIPDLFLKLGVATVGYNATGHWTGALSALIGLRLAGGNNLAGGVAGVATLTALGIGNLLTPTTYTDYYNYMTDPSRHPLGSTWNGIPITQYP